MATAAPRLSSMRAALAPDRYERGLATAAVILLAVAALAVLRGRAEWRLIPAAVWLHLATIFVALALTPVILLRPRGDRQHRLVGWVWVTAMLATAVISLFIRQTNHGGFSVIHILSAWTIIQAPVIVQSARRHNLGRHRRAVRGMVTGALLIAGFFTFPFGRLLGHWLFA